MKTVLIILNSVMCNYDLMHVYIPQRLIRRRSTVSPLLATKMLYANSLDPDETPSINIFTNFERHKSTMKIESDVKISRRQFMLRFD